MIFVGPNFSDSNAHFVTNVIDSVGTSEDLIIDVHKVEQKNKIFLLVKEHLVEHKEEYVIYNAKEDEDFFLSFRKEFPQLKLIIFFSDDEWRHSNYDRYLALFCDSFTIAVKDNLERYKNYGLDNVFYMRWGCNPDKFYPVVHPKKYDVTFIGAAYGKRIEYVRFLVANDVNIRVFGRGWSNCKDLLPFFGGCPSNSEMLDIIGQSKINLNFIWTSRHPDETTIKGRTLELAACNAFQISNYTEEFDNYGFIDGRNIVVFNSKSSLLNRVHYYLDQAEKREEIAELCYMHVTTSLTWKEQFNKLFDLVKGSDIRTHRKYSILVVSDKNVEHSISLVDERLDIEFNDGGVSVNYACYDGVIELSDNSSIENDTLYMMVFGLVVDESDVVASNFYVSSTEERYWIRFRDRLMDRKRELLKLLPVSCMMFSGAYAEKQGFKLPVVPNHLKVSYIEYPSFEIKISYYQSRKLRLYFGFYRNPRLQFEEFVQDMKIGKALSLGVDKLWQRLLNNMRGKSSEPFNKS